MPATILRLRQLFWGFVAGACAWLSIPQVAAQSLDDQYAFYLSDKCNELHFERYEGERPNDLVPGQAGPELDAFCSGLPLTGGSNSSSTVSSATAGTADRTGNEALRRRQASVHKGKDADAAADEFGILTSGQTSLFASVNYAREDQKTRHFEGGRRTNQLALTLGLDRRIGSTGLVGLAGGIDDQSGDFDTGGSFGNRGYSALFYGSWLPAPALFIDFNGGVVFHNADSHRVVSYTYKLNGSVIDSQSIAPARADSKTDQQEWRGSLLTGYDFSFGANSMGPRLAVDYQRTGIDGTVEAGTTPMTLVIDKQTEKSLRSGLGLQGSHVLTSKSAVFVIQLNADWWHEFQDDQRFISAHFSQDLRPDPTRFRYQNQPPDRDVFTGRASLAVTMPRGFSAFASVDGLFGHSYLNRYGAALGVRKEL